ncbi:ABC transporter permease [Sphingomonas sp.]|uniref:ABC transporter permease n=1 Tax=Sphingomonas sp. TaxID=28214 RepID=UPI0025D62B24|nr:ABC transporter permease [Sphingomonas sp.]
MKLPEIIRAAFVIARRDYTSTVLSKTFLLFLLGPLFPLMLGMGMVGIGAQVDRNSKVPPVAVVSSPQDFDLLTAARARLEPVTDTLPLVELRYVAPEPNLNEQRDRLLSDEQLPVFGVLDGGLDAPHLSGAVVSRGRTAQQIGLYIDEARRLRSEPVASGAKLVLVPTAGTAGLKAFNRSKTGQFAQVLLFVLTLLLATMVLSQLIEEKSSKVIEVLAAAVPIDAIFLGKLFAMLATSLTGIALWTLAGAAVVNSLATGGLQSLPAPAVGWPAFMTLIFVYFSMNYLLIGATFLGIGAQASTAREVQILSMPVTMAQLVLFGFASLAVGQPNGTMGIVAAIFPLSSPLAMIVRAAELPDIWPHLLAFAWQAIWVVLILRTAAAVFRRSVLKSGKSRGWRRFFRRAEGVEQLMIP